MKPGAQLQRTYVEAPALPPKVERNTLGISEGLKIIKGITTSACSFLVLKIIIIKKNRRKEGETDRQAE